MPEVRRRPEMPKFTPAQRRWVKAAFYDMAEYQTLRSPETVPQMWRSFSAMLGRKSRPSWRIASWYPEDVR